MTCPKCGSESVTTQIVSDVSVKNQHHGFLWWLCVGWWWLPIKWLVFTVPAIFIWILKICGVRKKKVISKQRTVCVCQSCGHTWDLK